MGVLTPVLAAAGSHPSAWDDRWYEGPSSMSSSGVRVSMDSALTVPAFFAGIAYVSEDIAKVPLNMFEDLGGDRGHQPAPAHYLQEKLHDQPNDYQTALEWREMMTAFAQLRGKGISEIRNNGRPLIDDQYIPLHPDLIDERMAGGKRILIYRDPKLNGQERRLLPDEVIVLRNRLGKSLIEIMRDTIGLAQAQSKHQSDLMRRGAKPGGVVKRDWGRTWADLERRNFRRALNEYATGGAYSGRPLLLEDGMTWQDVGMSNKDAEAIDGQRFTIIEFCRGIRIPPHKLFELERSTNNNIERQSVDYVVDSILGWAERWEAVIRRDLIILRDRLRFFAEHNLDGLMRGDFKGRMEGYHFAVTDGILTRDEVRRKENYNPKGGFADELSQPLNQGPVGSNAGGAANQVASAAAMGRAKLLAAGISGRLVRREMSGVEKLLERTDAAGLAAALDEFYAEHADQVARQLHLPDHQALAYARDHRAAVLAGGAAAMSEWLVDGVQQLTNHATSLEEAA